MRIVTCFCIAFRIFVAGNRRHFKFGMPIDHSKSQPTDDKLSLKWAWSRSRHVIHFKFQGPKHTWGITEARIVKFLGHIGYICRLRWCSSSRGFVSDSWATCSSCCVLTSSDFAKISVVQYVFGWSIHTDRAVLFWCFDCFMWKVSVNMKVYGFGKWCCADSGVVGETRPVERHQLEVLVSVRTITGALVVKTNDTDITDLSFLRNLETIYGRQLEWVFRALTLHSVCYYQPQTC